MTAQERRGVLAIAAAATLWGTTGTAAAYAPAVSSLAIGAGAMGVGGLLQAAVYAPAIRRNRSELRSHWVTVLVGGLCVVIYPLAFYSSMRVAGVALGNVVSLASAPLASALIERVLDGRALTRRWMLACLLGIGGAALMCLPHGGQTPGTGSPTLGVALGLIAGLTYAGYSRALRGLLAHRVDRKAATGAVFGVGGAALMPILVIAGGAAVATSPRALLVIGYLAVIPMFVGYLLFSRGLAGVDATTATTITLIEPAVATLTAMVFLGEMLTGAGWLGLVLLAAALALLLVPGRSPRSPGGTRRDSLVRS